MFRDRRDAGRRLAQLLLRYRGPDTIVLGLPRGGVPVAAEVAAALDAPLDVILVRKVGAPHQPELALGAVGEGGVTVANDEVLRHLRVADEEVAAIAERERETVAARAGVYRAGRDALDLRGRTAIVIDDGIATGSTARAACAVARAAGAARVVLAVPVAPADTEPGPWAGVDDFVCLDQPRRFAAVGQFYEDFGQTSDAEVVELLGRARQRAGGADSAATEPEAATAAEVDGEVEIPLPGATLSGHLTIPAGAAGLVLFAHGSGSSRHSPRNRYVAQVLHEAGLGTLLLDLLTTPEDSDRARVFDIPLLAGRLGAASDWVADHPPAAGLAVGYFGASTGAAAALAAAAARPAQVRAVVSRGGRPDLAIRVLPLVQAPTLLIVGGRDETVLELNREAQRHLRCRRELAVVPGATHLFEEPGALGQAADLARRWFRRHLSGTSPLPGGPPGGGR